MGELSGAKILMTGTTGQVGFPLAVTLAADNEVWAAARFSDTQAKERHEDAGIRCVTVDLAADDLGVLPDDFDYVLNFAVAHGGMKDFDRDLALNAEASGLLMAPHAGRRGRSCTARRPRSTRPAGHQALKETDPLGDNHRRDPADLQPVQDRGRGGGAHGGAPARACPRRSPA